MVFPISLTSFVNKCRLSPSLPGSSVEWKNPSLATDGEPGERNPSSCLPLRLQRKKISLPPFPIKLSPHSGWDHTTLLGRSIGQPSTASSLCPLLEAVLSLSHIFYLGVGAGMAETPNAPQSTKGRRRACGRGLSIISQQQTGEHF